ncbi:putative quinol monooxygenase [Actinosynnema sp. NPDC091369]
MTDKPYAVVGIAHAKPDEAEELKAILLSISARARGEEGCLEFRVGQDREDPAVLVFFEAWRSQVDVDRHLAQPYMASFMEHRMRYLERDVEVRMLSVESPYPGV